MGNPGPQYAETRHNVGFRVVDRLSAAHHIAVKSKSHHSLLGRGSIQGEEVILVKPETYMNRSGLAVSSLLRYTTATPADLILVFDDLDLAPGVLRVRQKGSAGGHRGMISVIQSVGTDELLRIRIGIGRPLHSWEVTQYVLSPFSREEKEVVDSALVRALRALEEIVAGNITAVMNEYNR